MVKSLIKVIAFFLTLTILLQTGVVGFAANVQEEEPVDEKVVETYYDGESLITSEITELREESVKHFSLEDGASLAVVYPEPVHYLSGDNWKNIDNSLVLNKSITDKSGNPVYSLKASDVDLRIPQDLNNGNKIEVSKNGNTFKMGLYNNGAADSEKAVIRNNIDSGIIVNENATEIEKQNTEIIKSALKTSKVEYKAAFEGADLEYTVSSSRIKENIVVNEKQDNYEYKFEINYGSLIPVTNEDGSISFFNSEDDEEAAFLLSAPYMVDASGEYSDSVEMSLSGNILTVTADSKWLNSIGRDFPVKIDPSVTVSSTSFIDSTVRYFQSGNNYGSEDTLYSGKGTLSLRRTYMKFTLPNMSDNAVILGAWVNITQKNISLLFNDDVKYINLFDLTGLSSWTESGITWNNQPLSTTLNGPQTNGTTVITYLNGQNGSNVSYSFGITSKVKQWYANNNNNGFMISTSNENKYCQPTFYSKEASSSKPYATIKYTNNIGIKDYWDYQTVNMENAGKALINTHNGSYYYIHDDAATSGLVLPVGISHIYGSTDGYSTGSFGYMKYGKGFILNMSEFIGSTTYRDSRGTYHNLVSNGSNQVLEDDPTTVLTSDSSWYYLTFIDGTVKKFYRSGFLRSIIDNNSNEITLSYVNNLLTQVKSGANQNITLAYNADNYLTSITDPGGRVTQFTYDSNNYLTDIEHPDGKHTYLSYLNGYLYEVKNSENARWRYTVSTASFLTNQYARVSSVTAYAKNNSNQYVDKLNFSYLGTSTTVSNNHNDSVEIEFDEVGRPVSYTSKGNTSKLNYNTNGILNNTLKSQSNSFLTNENLMRKADHRVASLAKSGSGLTVSSSTDRVNYYADSKKMVCSNTNGLIAPASSSGTRVTAGETYTAMIDVNIASVTGGSLYLKVTAGSVVEKSPEISSTGEDWMPLSAVITIPSGVSELTTELVFKSFTGTVYADIAQVTKGSKLAYFNLLPDSGFKAKSRYNTTDWTCSNGGEIDSGYARIYGSLIENRSIYQTVSIRGNANEELIFGASSKANAVSVGAYTYGIHLKFMSSGNIVCTRTMYFNVDVKETQHIQAPVSSSADFDSIQVEMFYNTQSDSAIFKDLFLYKGCVYGYNYTYNDNRLATQVTDGAGNSKLIAYSGADITGIQQKTNGETVGNVSYTYNSTHNILTATDNIQNITVSYIYPSSGNKGLPVSSTVSGSGNLSATTTYGYTSNYNYLTSITDPSGAVTQYSYNASKGWLTKVTDPNGNETNYSYNASDMISSIYADVGNDVAQVSYQYDSVNRLTNISNGSISYGFTYDIYGRSDTITNSGSTLTDLTYNSDSTVSRVDMAGGEYSTHTYDDRDRLTSTSYNGTLAYTYKYNDDNALTEVYDAENSETTSYIYDQIGRPLSVSRTDGKSTVFSYDSKGRPSKAVISDDTGIFNKQTYSYDSKNRVSGTSFSTINESVSYSYDGLNRLTSSTGTAGANASISTAYTYKTNGSNKTGRVNSVSYNMTINNTTTQIFPTVSYDYDANGNITKIYENGVEKYRYTYDSLNRLVREDNAKFNATIVYTYSTGGNILSKKFYNYTTSTTPSSLLSTESYTYGNSTWKDGVTTYDGMNISYNAAGQPTSYCGNTLTWSRGRLMSLNNGGEIEYKYDENGLRTYKKVYGNEIYYQYSGDKLVKQTDDWGSIEYYYGADGRPYALKYSDGEMFYYILNIQGDVLGLYNEDGELAVSYDYDAWGNCYVTDYMVSYVAYENPLRYRGYVYDDETSLYYLQNRYYDPLTGRFISADSYLVSGNHINGTNMFAYCLNNPVMYVDPRGCFAVTIDPETLATATAAVESVSAALSTIFPGMLAVFVGVAVAVVIVYASNQSYYEAVEMLDYASTASPPPPNKQTQTTSKKLYEKHGKNGYRIEVENPNPSQRPGQIHLQKDGIKYIYDIQNKQFVYDKTGEIAPKSIQKLLDEPRVVKEIAKGLKYLGY